MGETLLVRTFPLDATRLNQHKVDKLTDIHRESVKTVRSQLRFLQRSVIESGTLPKRMNTTGMPTSLPARYAAELSNTSLGLVKSWKSNLINAASNSLRKSSVRKNHGEDFYRLVYRLISFGYGIGEGRDVSEKVFTELELTEDQKVEAIRLCRQIVRNHRKHRRFPTFSRHASVTFGGKVVSVSNSVNTSFDAVVTFMGTARGKPICAPVNLPNHTASKIATGFTMSDCVQLCPQRDGSVRLRVVCKGVAERAALDPDVVIGIDVGAVHPVVTSMGDVYVPGGRSCGEARAEVIVYRPPPCARTRVELSVTVFFLDVVFCVQLGVDKVFIRAVYSWYVSRPAMYESRSRMEYIHLPP